MGKKVKTEVIQVAAAEEIVPLTSSLATTDKAIVREQIEAVYTESLSAVVSTMAFGDVEPAWDDEGCVIPNSAKIPEGWIELYGVKEAKKRTRLAEAGWMNKGRAPNALDVAVKLATTVMKVDAVKQQSAKVLNIGVAVAMGPIQDAYPEQIIEEES
jgi:hypothetical protein